ncbi:acyltransferase domain-containing protein [Kitasatospora sp. NPDC058201]|uniref:acyltransferase domain-containing protein n=1 Tax=Streptomycetaceae TaxID=2062 RepID=UPI002E797C89|nr:acyltransferase domain-containing protein [Streptomyces sp. BE303]MED7950336.1 acyltransferase domain-containing protein [Streptomyces sp. BE303]
MTEHRRTVLLLPGQGAQRERMAAGLYGTEPVFTEHLDRLFTALGARGDRLRENWLSPAPNPALDEAEAAQPLLLAVGHALGRAVEAAAGPPELLLGHSIGELAAAALADVLPADRLAVLVDARTGDLDPGTRGGLLAVAAAPTDLPPRLGPGIAVAAVNGPRQTVLAGPSAALDAAADLLRAAGLTVRALRSGHAFHSPALAPAARRFGTALGDLGLRPPRTTVFSARTAAPVRPGEALDPRFWADQLALPVRWWPALSALLDRAGTRPGLLLLDAAPDRSLSTPARRHPAVRSGASVIVPLLADHRRTGTPADRAAFDAAVALLDAGAGPHRPAARPV